MDSQSVMKKARISSEDREEKDRISNMPDELLHEILKFVDIKLGVQTSALSKRWKLVWTTLPFLKLKWDQQCSAAKTTNLARHVLTRRNHRSQIKCLEMALLPRGLIAKFIEYAISRSVEYLKVQFRSDHKQYKLSNFKSKTMKELELEFKLGDMLSVLDCWDLPDLTTLSLIRKVNFKFYNFDIDRFPEIYLTCLPKLRNLLLERWDLLSWAFSLPELRSLVLRRCKLPNKVWNLPALTSLTLADVEFPVYMKDLFTSLVNLQNLKLFYKVVSIRNCFIHCPQLATLEIETHYDPYCVGVPNSTVEVFAPKLSKFTSVGIFPIKFVDSKLEYVNVKLRDWFDNKFVWREKLKECYRQFTTMLPGLGSAKVLNLDLETIEALISIFDILASFPSPFYDLKYVKLPHGCNEASLSGTLRNYLLGASPTATIVTALPQFLSDYEHIIHEPDAELKMQPRAEGREEPMKHGIELENSLEEKSKAFEQEVERERSLMRKANDDLEKKLKERDEEMTQLRQRMEELTSSKKSALSENKVLIDQVAALKKSLAESDEELVQRGYNACLERIGAQGVDVSAHDFDNYKASLRTEMKNEGGSSPADA